MHLYCCAAEASCPQGRDFLCFLSSGFGILAASCILPIEYPFSRSSNPMMKCFLALIPALSLLISGCTQARQNSSSSSSTSTATSSGNCQSLMVPSYLSSGSSSWKTLVSDAPWSSSVTRTLLLNPNSGPGSAADSSFQQVVTTLHSAGAKVYGYVYTNYGAVSLATAEAQVDEYIQWYGVDGIFLDCSSSDASLVSSYYQPLATYITTKISGGGVILNAGTYPDASYAAITVPSTSTLRIVVFEDDYSNFTSTSAAEPSWAKSYPASRFIDIVYNTSSANLANALSLSAERNVGSVYMTDDTLPNPYDTIPGYWSTLVKDTQAGCS